MTGDDPCQLPVEHLAQLLVQRARRDPSLQSRSPANSNQVEAPETPAEPARADPLAEIQHLADLIVSDWRGDTLAEPEPDPNLEEFYDPDEEDAWQPDEAERPSARRRVILGAAVAGVAALVAVVLLAEGRFTDVPAPTRVAAAEPEPHALQAAEQRIDAQISKLRSEVAQRPEPVVTPAAAAIQVPVRSERAIATPREYTAAQHATTPAVAASTTPANNDPVAAAPQAVATAQPVATKPLPPTTYWGPVNRHAYSPPPPYRYRAPIRQYAPVRRYESRPPDFVVFVTTLSRNVRALFR